MPRFLPRLRPRFPPLTPGRGPGDGEPDRRFERAPLAAAPQGRHRDGEAGSRDPVDADPVGAADAVDGFGGVVDVDHRIGRIGRIGLSCPRLPDRLAAARFVGPRRAVLGLLVVTALVSGALGLRFAMASAAARPVAVDPATRPVAMTASGTGASASTTDSATPAAAQPLGATPAATSAATSAASSGVLVVDVAGRVHHPGVLRLPAGARVQDALVAAGGPLPGSDLVSLNLAQPLGDGEQVVVGRAGSDESSRTSGGGAQGSSVSGGSGGDGTSSSGSGGVPVDLNTADVTALDSLPGVGPVLAGRILDWRTAHGRFTSIDELDEVSGIGEKLLAQIRPHVHL